ncbi:hypothetical protein BGP78_04670 [Pseudoalteromonas sp. MSK9-3]|uniref:S41 family peptidase n=1 Tax=Pseudoalteromonas sp. MSK9-3 TaxID=1897633 RepID=UPI000E6BC0B9|nr:S41 family peptidase [Pseudoalteromonas sp. MSK9-3]RJE78418.1 hypothetical protein BGP78_04670 [Pseudoalteromonas sp. MSK9-3]
MKKSMVLALSSVMIFLNHAECQETSFNAEKAMHELQSTLSDNYAYLHDRERSAEALLAPHKTKLLASKTTKEFRDSAQAYLRTFADPHLNLGPYDQADHSVYPTGSDIFVQFEHDKLMIYDIKSGSDAHIKGLKPGMQVKSVDGQSIELAIEHVTGLTVNKLTQSQRNYAANIALGGKRNQARTLVVYHQGIDKAFNLAASYNSINALKSKEPVTIEVLGDFSYVRFNNALGDLNTVDVFKREIKKLHSTKGIIIDLRNTPSGGNTGVAEPILGHFTDKQAIYQLYKVQSQGKPYEQSRMQSAQVTPQVPYLSQPFVVLAGRWTGSMGEGMVIGLNALGAKKVIGAPMADLLGGIKHVKLPYSDSWLEVGFERLYQTNGEYREDFEPHILLKSADIGGQGNDVARQQALAFLTNNIKAL